MARDACCLITVPKVQSYFFNDGCEIKVKCRHTTPSLPIRGSIDVFHNWRQFVHADISLLSWQYAYQQLVAKIRDEKRKRELAFMLAIPVFSQLARLVASNDASGLTSCHLVMHLRMDCYGLAGVFLTASEGTGCRVVFDRGE